MILVLVNIRATSPQAAQELCRVSLQAVERNQEPGWLGGRCVVNARDPLHVVIVEEWGSRAAFDAWYKSPGRLNIERQTAHFRAGTIQVEVYEEV
jgi:quinol monooxygenase YgiN